MFDWNNNGERDAFDFAMDMMVLDEDGRNRVLEDAGLDADDYDFE